MGLLKNEYNDVFFFIYDNCHRNFKNVAQYFLLSQKLILRIQFLY